MNEIIKKIEDAQLKDGITEFRVGDTIRVHGKIKEGNRERIQVFEGVVLKRQGGGARETFTVRKSSNGVGVEKTWPLHSPNVEKIEVVRRGDVRRAKLNYLRQRSGKLLESLELFDIYEGTQVGEGKKSVAYKLVLRAKDRTLEEKDIAGVMNKVLNGLGQIGVELRS